MSFRSYIHNEMLAHYFLNTFGSSITKRYDRISHQPGLPFVLVFTALKYLSMRAEVGGVLQCVRIGTRVETARLVR
jgi:hypothetical protein